MSISVIRWDDAASWNEFISSTPRPHFQQTWEWGELAPQLGGQAVRLGAVRGGRLIGAMQVFANPISVIGKTYLYVPRGPAVFDPSVEVLGPLFDAARRVGFEHDAIGIRLEPEAAACDRAWKDVLSALGLRPSYPPSQPRSSWVLDITPDDESLLAGMRAKTRYNIRLADRKGVEVVEGGPEDVSAFYRLLRETAKRDDFFIHSEDLYRRMYDLFWNDGVFCLLLATYHGEAIAGITLVRCGAVCWYLHGASSNAHRNLMATYLLQWKGIQWAKAQGCRRYDFRAVPDILRDDQDMYGVYRFKEGFGGHHVTTLHTYVAPYQPSPFGLWQLYFTGRFALNAWIRRRQGLPARQFA